MSTKYEPADLTGLSSNLTKNHDNKELVKRYQVISSTLTCVIDARLYMGRSSSASVVYCDLWIHGGSQYGSANGSAGGYGYDKQFAALHEAVSNSGIKMLNQQHGVESMLLGIAYSLDNTQQYKVF